MRIFFSKSGALDFKTGVNIEMFFAVFSTLKHVVLCERCSTVSQREPGLSLEEFVQDANSLWCRVYILVKSQIHSGYVDIKHYNDQIYKVPFSY